MSNGDKGRLIDPWVQDREVGDGKCRWHLHFQEAGFQCPIPPVLSSNQHGLPGQMDDDQTSRAVCQMCETVALIHHQYFCHMCGENLQRNRSRSPLRATEQREDCEEANLGAAWDQMLSDAGCLQDEDITIQKYQIGGIEFMCPTICLLCPCLCPCQVCACVRMCTHVCMCTYANEYVGVWSKTPSKHHLVTYL